MSTVTSNTEMATHWNTTDKWCQSIVQNYVNASSVELVTCVQQLTVDKFCKKTDQQII
jgi:hypothetical protein